MKKDIFSNNNADFVLLIYGAVMGSVLLWISCALLPTQLNLMGIRVYILQLFLQDGTFISIADGLLQIPDVHISYYFYTSLYGLLTGQTQAEDICIQVQLIAFGIIFFFLPCCVARLFCSLRLALISPVLFFLLIWQYFLHVFYTDYWGMGWVIFLSVPFLYLFLNSPGNSATLWKIFAALCVLVGIVNIPRAHSGIGIIIMVVLLMLYKVCCYNDDGICKKIICSVCVIVLAGSGYFLFTSMIPNVYLSVLGYDNSMTAVKVNKMGAWHTLYIGLGWDSPASIAPKLSFLASENPYNIIYLDECAMEAVSRENQISIPESYIYIQEKLGYTTTAKIALSKTYTEGYFDIVKKLYLEAFEEHPLWFIGSYIKKLCVCILMLLKDTFAYIAFVFLVYFITRKKHQVHFGNIVGKELYGVLVGLTFLGFLPGLVAVPAHVYLLESVAAVQSICFLMLLEILASIPFFKKDGNLYGG